MGAACLLLFQRDGHGVQLPGEGERMVESPDSQVFIMRKRPQYFHMCLLWSFRRDLNNVSQCSEDSFIPIMGTGIVDGHI